MKQRRDKEIQEAQARERVQQERVEKTKYKVSQNLEESKKTREDRKRAEIEFGRLYSREDIQHIMVVHSKLIETVFKFYTGSVGGKYELDINRDKIIMNFKQFNRFASNFNVWPGLMTRDE
jgi:hypothetical protein